MSEIDPSKMKVPELRDSLKNLGLDCRGNKATLVKRLIKAQAGGAGETGDEDTSQDQEDESFSDNVTSDQHMASVDEGSDIEQAEEAIEDTVKKEIVSEKEYVIEKEDVSEKEYAIKKELASEKEDVSEKENVSEKEYAIKKELTSEKENVAEETGLDDVSEHSEHDNICKEESISEQEGEEAEGEIIDKEGGEGRPDMKSENCESEASVNGTKAMESQDCDDEGPPENLDGLEVMDSVGDVDGDPSPRGQKRKHSRDRSRDRMEKKKYETKPIVMEDDDWLKIEDVVLDRYNSDMHLRIKENNLKANPITMEGFAFMWAGARANYGIRSGKIVYEVKVLENLNVDHLPTEEATRHVVRVGWSTDDCSMQLGEEELSWGYGGTAKKSNNCKFADYGEIFGENDVVHAYLDMDSDPIVMTFSKNGQDMGSCYSVPKEELGDKTLFPHVLTKNTEFEVNFGSREEPFFPVTDGYEFIGKIPLEERVRGSLPPEKKEECEMIMMCGLPGCGKTTWVEKHCKENLSKKYNVLGTNAIIDKMKVMGLPRKKNYAGRWDQLIDKATKALNRLFEIAARKKRNYILDQTNVYPSAQRRKMRPFEGFKRKAIVMVPEEEEFKTRCEKREKEEGKDVPDSAVLEMKAHFSLPDKEGGLFDEIDYVELGEDEATKVVEKFNKEARDKLPPPDRRRYENRRDSRYDRYDDRRRDRKPYERNDRRYDSRGSNRSNYGYARDDRRRDDRRYDNRYDSRSSGRSNWGWGGNSGHGGHGGWSGGGGGWGSWNNQGHWGNGHGWSGNSSHGYGGHGYGGHGYGGHGYGGHGHGHHSGSNWYGSSGYQGYK